MARSACPNSKCGGNTFEMVEHEPRKSQFKVMFIQCASCGCVVGVTDYFNIGNLIYRMAKKMRIDLDS